MIKYLLIFVTAIIILISVYSSFVKNMTVIKERKKNKQMLISDLYINYPLLFLWLVFMAAFGFGLIINNIWPE